MAHRSFIEKKLIFWRHLFLANYSNGPGVTKNWHMSKLTKKGPRDVIRCLESKFDKKIPMGSVPNCRKEIPVHHAIRWFKCKLKPPNKSNKHSTIQGQSFIYRVLCTGSKAYSLLSFNVQPGHCGNTIGLCSLWLPSPCPLLFSLPAEYPRAGVSPSGHVWPASWHLQWE